MIKYLRATPENLINLCKTGLGVTPPVQGTKEAATRSLLQFLFEEGDKHLFETFLCVADAKEMLDLINAFDGCVSVRHADAHPGKFIVCLTTTRDKWIKHNGSFNV